MLSASPFTTLAARQSLVALGDSDALDLKRSTAELRRPGHTLYALLSGEGGRVVTGVGPDGTIVGQRVADHTLRDIAAMLGRFEPAADPRVAHPESAPRLDEEGGIVATKR